MVKEVAWIGFSLENSEGGNQLCGNPGVGDTDLREGISREGEGNTGKQVDVHKVGSTW